MYTESEIHEIKKAYDIRAYFEYAEQLYDTFPYEYPIIQDLLPTAIYVTETISKQDSDIIDEYVKQYKDDDLLKLTMQEWHNITKIDNTLRELLIAHYGSNEDIEKDSSYACSCMNFYLINGILISYLANNKLLVDIPLDKDILDNIVNFIKSYQ